MSKHLAIRTTGFLLFVLTLSLPQITKADADGKIISLTPCDDDPNPAPSGSQITFIVISNIGVKGGKTDTHKITLSLKVVDQNGNVVCQSEKSKTLINNQGQLGFWTSCDDANLVAGKYTVKSTITDRVNGAAPERELDSKECTFSQSASGPSASGQSVTAREADELVPFHNKMRDEVAVGPVKWSPTLAKFAQEWADEVARTGKIGHRPKVGEFAQKYGENIAWGSGGGYDVLTGARSWYEEKKFYTPGTPIPENFENFKAGHYTQMVWENSTEIGAGMAVIQTGGKKGYLFVVCNYNPRGNIIGEKPY